MNRRIKYSFKYMLAGLFLLTSFYLLSPTARMALAEGSVTIFNKDIFYNVYYEVSKYEVDCLEGVKVLDTVIINDIPFLVIKGTGITENKGYILLSSVRAILPSGLKPNRTSYMKKE